MAVSSLCPACERLMSWGDNALERAHEANRQLRDAALSYEKDLFARALERSKAALEQCEQIRKLFREHAAEHHGRRVSS